MNNILKTTLLALASSILFCQGLFATTLVLGEKYEIVYMYGVNGHPTGFGTHPFVEFPSKDRIAGCAGVNRFNTSFDLRGDGSINIGAIATTRMMGDATDLAYERSFLNALSKSKKIEGDKSSLSFLAKDGKLMMKFKLNLDKTAKVAPKLANTKWSVVFLDGAKKPFAPMGDGRVPYIEFSSADKINGFAGDNIFNGSYKLEKNGELKIGDNLAVTMMMGMNGEYEHAFLQALRKVAKAEIKDAGMLCLFDKKDNLLMHLKPSKEIITTRPHIGPMLPKGQRPVAPLTEEERAGELNRRNKLR